METIKALLRLPDNEISMLITPAGQRYALSLEITGIFHTSLNEGIRMSDMRDCLLDEPIPLLAEDGNRAVLESMQKLQNIMNSTTDTLFNLMAMRNGGTGIIGKAYRKLPNDWKDVSRDQNGTLLMKVGTKDQILLQINVRTFDEKVMPLFTQCENKLSPVTAAHSHIRDLWETTADAVQRLMEIESVLVRKQNLAAHPDFVILERTRT